MKSIRNPLLVLDRKSWPGGFRLFPIALLAVLAAGCSLEPTHKIYYTETVSAVDSTNKVGVDIYKILAKDEGNLCISPLSIATNLSTVLAGARGKTADELNAVLGIPPGGGIHEGFSELRATIEGTNSEDCQTILANVLAYQEGMDLNAQFLGILDKNYSAARLPLNFANRSDDARDRLNTWIAENTKGRIQGFLTGDDITPYTRVILANALTFDAKWDREFDPNDTKEAPFFPEDEREVSVPMMKRKGVFRLSAPADGVQVLRLPYRGGQVEMVLVLPVMGEKLKTVERALSVRQLQQWVDRCQSEPSEVYLPRFTGHTRSDLLGALSQLGMACAFKPTCADFSGITSEPYHVGLVKHGCYVEVDEEGTKAAAVTATGLLGGGAGDEFRADRPFLYFIRETTSGAILLMGRVTNPMALET